MERTYKNHVCKHLKKKKHKEDHKFNSQKEFDNKVFPLWIMSLGLVLILGRSLDSSHKK